MSVFGIFAVKKEERLLAFAMLFVFLAFNALLISSHFGVYTMGAHGGFWSLFTKNFRMSGYDNWSWITISCMRVHFETIRHPLFLALLYPLYWLNHWLINAVGINFAVFFMAIIIVFSAFYSVIFTYRILREVLELQQKDATLLTLFLFSFGHILVPAMVPDHFIISLMLLTMTLYIAGIRQKQDKFINAWESFLLIFFTAGMAASNAGKTILAGLFTNGRKFFSFKYLTIGIILPLALLFGIQQMQYYQVEVPQEEVTKKIVSNKKKKQPGKFEAHTKKRNAWLHAHTGQAASSEGIGKLMDISTSRTETLIENFFGEPIQLHQDYLLKDVSWDRPIFVKYSWIVNYVVEALIVLLFLIGIVAGWRYKFMKMLLLWFACDFTLHIIMGFAINEVYIMTAGWAFIIPISIGYLLRILSRQSRFILRITLVLLTSWLLVYNGGQIIYYLIS
ncbi:DUF6080 domain-containing protein [Prevotella intermedia]|uniref:Uncharacterized protein n=1 Tax=Prevotella intermedia TaxID=28131 RepID=A0A2A6EF73_PREIN|nr:DUF6080 domain-containing protein [Prevotella intermedia]PDP60562.1 hypothetical protein CLI71_04510 [Prevotella intermedia]